MWPQELSLRLSAKSILNTDLVAQAEAFAALEERLDEYESYQEALDAGFVKDVRKELSKNYRMGIKLEGWINTFTPPLASGGNVGVSGEVQDGIFSHVHALTAGSSEAIHRALAFEKEFAVQKTKCDAETWERYRDALAATQLHDLTKSVLQARSDCLSIANSVANNLEHLHKPAEDKIIAHMY